MFIQNNDAQDNQKNQPYEQLIFQSFLNSTPKKLCYFKVLSESLKLLIDITREENGINQ